MTHEVANLLSSLRGCTRLGVFNKGRVLHQRVISLGLQDNLLLCKTLINFYLSSDLYPSAISVFHSIPNKPLDITLWNSLISASSKNADFFHAISLFRTLLHSPHLSPDSFTLPPIFKSFAALSLLPPAVATHSFSIKTAFLSDVVVASSAVSMYSKFGLFDSVVKVFEEMRAADRDVASWNTVISAYYHGGLCESALEAFDEMTRFGLAPDSVTLTTVIASCARTYDFGRGAGVHREVVRKGVVLDEYVGAALVDMYGKFGRPEMAAAVFERVVSRGGAVLWNAMIAAHGSAGDAWSGLRLFGRMVAAGVRPTPTTLTGVVMACSRSAHLRPGRFAHGYAVRNGMTGDVYLDVALVDLYFKCGSVGSARAVFARMPKEEAVSWNVMISGLVSAGRHSEALEVFEGMAGRRVGVDAVTLANVLPACSHLGALGRGVEIHRRATDGGFESNQIVMAALLDMYSKCGDVDEARRVFDRLPERDVVSWTTMVAAYGSHGRTSEAVELFRRMEDDDVAPDEVAFTALISACGHAGLVGEGYFYFKRMVSNYGIMPTVELYSCLVDMLGRAGRVREAYGILRWAPRVRDDPGLLSTLLSACGRQGDLDLAEELAGAILEKDPDDPSTYIVLSRLYASVGKWGEARDVRARMEGLNLRKNPGCSWLEVDDKIHSFFVDRCRSHRQAGRVLECLELLATHMEKDEHAIQTFC